MRGVERGVKGEAISAAATGTNRTAAPASDDVAANAASDTGHAIASNGTLGCHRSGIGT